VESAPPPPSAPKPQQVVEPVVEPVVAAAEPIVAQVEPVVTQVDPVVAQVEPVVAPVAAAAAPVIGVAGPIVESAEPAAEPIVETVQPVVEPIVDVTETIIEKAEPIAAAVQPLDEPIVEVAAPVRAPAPRTHTARVADRHFDPTPVATAPASIAVAVTTDLVEPPRTPVEDRPVVSEWIPIIIDTAPSEAATTATNLDELSAPVVQTTSPLSIESFAPIPSGTVFPVGCCAPLTPALSQGEREKASYLAPQTSSPARLTPAPITTDPTPPATTAPATTAPATVSVSGAGPPGAAPPVLASFGAAAAWHAAWLLARLRPVGIVLPNLAPPG